MGELVALPVWLVVLVSALALLSLFGHFLMPGTRWVLRRRVYRVIEDVNSRLRIDLPPFMLTKRDRLIDRLIYDEKLLDAAAEAAAERDVPQQIVVEEIRGYAEEIVPGFNAYFYFRLGYRLARRFIRFFYRVRIGYADQETLDKVDSGASLVLVMNHRSNFDYLLVTYLASRRARALLRGGRVDAVLAGGESAARDGRLFRPAQFAESSLPARGRALCPARGGGPGAAGAVSRGRAVA